MANLGVLALAAGLALVAGGVLYAIAAKRARAIEAAPDEDRAHELRVLLKRMSSVGAGCGGGTAGLAIVLTIQQPAVSVAAGVLTGVVALLCAAFPLVLARRPVIAALCPGARCPG